MFGVRAGRVAHVQRVPPPAELLGFDIVVARLPHEDLALAAAYESAGFRFVTVDFAVSKAVPEPAAGAHPEFVLRVLSKQAADFPVSGFFIEGSRLSLDPYLRARMPTGFWDQMIENHCSEFADWTLCALDQSGALAGFVSCLDSASRLDMFLFAVHPRHAGHGCGRLMMGEMQRLAAKAGKVLASNVVSSNYRALNFYAVSGFRVDAGDVVMHFSRGS